MFRTILIKFPENFHSSILVLLAPKLIPSFDKVRERFPKKKEEHFHDFCHKTSPPPPSDGISSHQFFTLFFAIESCIYGTVFTLGPNQK